MIEIENLKILVDTGWHREISPDGEYNRITQVKHMGLGHFLINQGVLPKGESITEQLEKINILPRDIDFVILTHLHTDHASGLTAIKINVGEKFVLLYSDGGYATKSWQEMIPPGTVLDEESALKSLQWIRQMSLDKNCVESLANHDADVLPHEIIL